MEEEGRKYYKDAFGRDILISSSSAEGRKRSRSRDRDAGSSSNESDSGDSTHRREHSRTHTHGEDRRHTQHHVYYRPAEDKERSVPHILLANINPRKTFKEYIRLQDNSITPEAAHQGYLNEMKRYDEEIANRMFDIYCREEWMQEKYVPTRIQQRLRERYDEIQSLHRRLSEFIATGQILSEGESGSPFQRRLNDDVESHCVFIDNLPYKCSRHEFRALLAPFEGVQAIYVGHPLICPPSGLYRAAWICTDTAESAEKIVEALSKETEFLIDPITRENGGMKLNCSLQCPFKQSSYIPAVLNTAESVQEDLSLCKKALRALESYWEVDVTLEPCLSMLKEVRPDTTDVDCVYVVTWFLRHVFGFDYWRVAEDEDFGISLQKFGRDLIRSAGKNSNPSQSDLDWVRNHRESIGRFIAKKEKETVRGKLEEETEELQREREIRASIPQLLESLERKEENWNCVVCGKEFETQDTLENHIRNYHNEKVEGVVLDRVLKEISKEMYLNDKTKIVPIIDDPKNSKSRYCSVCFKPGKDRFLYLP